MVFENLFLPINVGTLQLKNRIVMAPMCTGLAGPDGSVTERLIDYYEERARGGAALVIVEYSYTDDKASKSMFTQLGVHHDGLLPGLSDLAEAIQAQGALAGLQICHAGRQRFLGTYPMVAPSRIPWKSISIIPTELTVEEIQEIEDSFAEAAARAKKAGFDIVEIHGGHGYLITEFLSPYTNRRNDLYGGSLENRARFAIEVATKVRKAVGKSYPLSFRISGDEYVDGGFRLEEAKDVAVELERAGIDVIHVSGGIHETDEKQIVPMYLPLCYNTHLAEGIKKVVKIPVIASGSITSPDLAEEIIATGKADLVSLARPLLADPYYPAKAREGRVDDIRKCIRCNEGCVGRLRKGKSVHCTVNAESGRERRYRLSPAVRPKSVMVIGGGPGGLECSRVLAERGHKVTLYEREEQLGGNALVASVPAFKNEIAEFIRFLVGRIRKLGVEIVLNTEADFQLVNEANPDVVVVATGAKPMQPPIPGILNENVVTAVDVLKNSRQVGERVVIAGGGMVGCETAWFLADKGHKVTIVEMLDDIAIDVEKASRVVLLHQISQLGVKVITNLRVTEISARGVAGVDKDFIPTTVEADTVILALGMEAETSLYNELQRSGYMKPTFRLGDCFRPGKIIDAVHQAAAIAREI